MVDIEYLPHRPLTEFEDFVETVDSSRAVFIYVATEYPLVVDEFIEWVQNRDYYHDQIQFKRQVSARNPVTRSCEMDARVTAQLTNRGIEELYAHQSDTIEAVRSGQNVVLATRRGHPA